MSRLLCALFISTCLIAHAQVANDFGYFRIALADDWRYVPGNDPEQHVFRSDKQKSQITISIIRIKAPEDKLKSIAGRLLQLRRKGETAEGNTRATIKSERILEVPDGYDISYSGFDPTNRYFRYRGFVRADRILSFYCESLNSNEEANERVFARAIEAFKF